MAITSEDRLRKQSLISIMLILCSYRAPMKVSEAVLLPECRNPSMYYVCPRCRITMEREFMQFCDRCGQCLDWKDYKKTRLVNQDALFKKSTGK